MKKKFTILFVFVSFIFLILSLWWYQAGKPPDPSDASNKIFTVEKGESIRSIAERLEKESLIRSPLAFFLLVRFGGFSKMIQAGDFRINPSMNLSDITQALTHGTIDTWIVIPEGWRNEEIALKLAKELNIPEKEFLKVAKEGYMFPDSYLFPKDATAAAVANSMMGTFQKKVDSSIRKKASQKNLSFPDLIIIASLVEREARLDQDRPLIASVILNRLSMGMKLDIDATIQYILGFQPKEKTWWKKNLTSEDLQTESLYNTYLNAGLPPTPITNPGLLAMSAVVDAPSTSYLYYIADSSGKSHFARSLEEHNANISKYLH